MKSSLWLVTFIMCVLHAHHQQQMIQKKQVQQTCKQKSYEKQQQREQQEWLQLQKWQQFSFFVGAVGVPVIRRGNSVQGITTVNCWPSSRSAKLASVPPHRQYSFVSKPQPHIGEVYGGSYPSTPYIHNTNMEFPLPGVSPRFNTHILSPMFLRQMKSNKHRSESLCRGVPSQRGREKDRAPIRNGLSDFPCSSASPVTHHHHSHQDQSQLHRQQQNPRQHLQINHRRHQHSDNQQRHSQPRRQYSLSSLQENLPVNESVNQGQRPPCPSYDSGISSRNPGASLKVGEKDFSRRINTTSESRQNKNFLPCTRGINSYDGNSTCEIRRGIDSSVHDGSVGGDFKRGTNIGSGNGNNGGSIGPTNGDKNDTSDRANTIGPCVGKDSDDNMEIDRTRNEGSPISKRNLTSNEVSRSDSISMSSKVLSDEDNGDDTMKNEKDENSVVKTLHECTGDSEQPTKGFRTGCGDEIVPKTIESEDKHISVSCLGSDDDEDDPDEPPQYSPTREKLITTSRDMSLIHANSDIAGVPAENSISSGPDVSSNTTLCGSDGTNGSAVIKIDNSAVNSTASTPLGRCKRVLPTVLTWLRIVGAGAMYLSFFTPRFFTKCMGLEPPAENPPFPPSFLLTRKPNRPIESVKDGCNNGGSAALPFLIFTGAALSDWFDGAAARAWNVTSASGALLDAAADKLLTTAALGGLSYRAALSGVGLSILPAVSLISLRDLGVQTIRLLLQQKGISDHGNVTELAKRKTAVQMISIALLILCVPPNPTAYEFYYYTSPFLKWDHIPKFLKAVSKWRSARSFLYGIFHRASPPRFHQRCSQRFRCIRDAWMASLKKDQNSIMKKLRTEQLFTCMSNGIYKFWRYFEIFSTPPPKPRRSFMSKIAAEMFNKASRITVKVFTSTTGTAATIACGIRRCFVDLHAWIEMAAAVARCCPLPGPTHAVTATKNTVAAAKLAVEKASGNFSTYCCDIIKRTDTWPLPLRLPVSTLRRTTGALKSLAAYTHHVGNRYISSGLEKMGRSFIGTVALATGGSIANFARITMNRGGALWIWSREALSDTYIGTDPSLLTCGVLGLWMATLMSVTSGIEYAYKAATC